MLYAVRFLNLIFAIKMLVFTLAYAFVVICICKSEGQICRTPAGGKSVCKTIYECKPLLALAEKNNRSPQGVDLIEKSKCLIPGNNEMVCCPDTCYTPDGQPGTCVNIHWCPHLADMLKPPLYKDNMIYVQNSKCYSDDQFSVCCGPRRDSPPPLLLGECKDRVSAIPPDPRSGCCGIDTVDFRSSVDSNTTALYEHPWLVIIEYEYSNQIQTLSNLGCGGVLISGRYALTRARCVFGDGVSIWKPKNVRLGEHDTGNNSPDCIPTNPDPGVDAVCKEGIVTIPIESFTSHPEYVKPPGSRKNDIGLIRLKYMAPYTDFIRPICLPSMDILTQDPQDPPKDLRFYTAGWNRNKNKIKLQLELSLYSSEDCQYAYTFYKEVNVWEKHVCAGDEARSNFCTADFGGPLMYKNDNQFEVLGLLSIAFNECTTLGYPSIYTKVYEYLTWIRSNMSP